jgi:oligopeptide transport system substrate-binding protein
MLAEWRLAAKPAGMPRVHLGRLIATALVTALALVPGACRGQPEGTIKVLVIGSEPKASDPAQAALSGPDSVLLNSVGQGLVQFDATGNIVGGLAERWNVSDDGMSYIFRIASTNWADGRKVTAQQVARILKRSLGPASTNPLKDTLGAIDDIVAMTDRVIEIRLKAPRPNLLAILAQPEFAIVRSGVGTGPFRIAGERGPEGELKLRRDVTSGDGEDSRREQVLLAGAAAADAVRAFAAGTTDLVLGGTFTDLPHAQSMKLPRNSLRFDPAAGLFGLVPARKGSPLDDPEVRRLLSQAVDRDALVDALHVPGLAARATTLEPVLEGVPDPVTPAWLATPIAQRRPTLAAEATRLFGAAKPTLRLFIPEGPGGDLLFGRLFADWSALGFTVERAKTAAGADLKLVDAVAPSTSPAWFLRQFRCQYVPVCDADTDTLLDAARDASVPAQRSALLSQAAGRIDDAQLFIPLTAPIRWSLVSARIQGFAGNRFARHTLTDLEQKIGAQ